MKKQELHIDNLIARYLTGEALPDEAIALDQWRAESPENERYFANAYTLYHGADQTQPKFDALKSWNKISNDLEPEVIKKVEPTPETDEKRIPIQRSRPSLWRVAAGIALFATLGLALIYLIRPGAVTADFASDQSITTDTLFTGSLVSLNTQSSLKYRYDKKPRTESMELTGEAWFDLKAPEGVATVVEAGGLTIRDIGTAFHVSAYPQADTVLVWVDAGEVAIYTAENPGLSLGPGEGGIFIKSTGHISAHTPALQPNWYQTAKAFHFNNASLREIAKAFNTDFEQKLYVPEHLGTCRITVSFVDESPLSMATIISETLGLTLEQKGDSLYLSGNGCPL